MTPGNYLLRRRLKANISQKQLAAKMGVTNVLIHQWERDKTPIPRKVISKLATLLGFPKEEFLRVVSQQFVDDLYEDVGK